MGVPLQNSLSPYRRYLGMGGVVDIEVTSDAPNTTAAHAQALATLLRAKRPKALATIRPSEIDETTFHGNWFDVTKRKLTWRGNIIDKARTKHDNPYLSDFAEYTGRSSEIPNLWDVGGFAYAFVDPPYGLRGTNAEIEQAYLGTIQRILPQIPKTILNWHCPRLLHVAPDLKYGADWWGVFAFTIHLHEWSEVIAIASATTD